jgi:polyisoprenoid-binding protein YceI
MRSIRAVMWTVACLLSVVSAASLPAAQGRVWRVEGGDVRIACPLTVGGSFEATTTSLAGSISQPAPNAPSGTGEFIVDLRTLDSGIGLRNDHLRSRYLEVEKGEGFEKAVVSDIRMPGVDLDSFQGRTTFTGSLLLHGTTKTITGQVDIRRSPASVRIEASFPVTLADYGIAKPRYLGVGVKDTVQAKISFTATSPEAAR